MTKHHSAVLILAAGESRRMGRPKQMLEYHGRSLLQISIEKALATGWHVIVVLGAHRQLTMPVAKIYPVITVVNKHYAEGLSTSVSLGIKTATTQIPNLQGVLITLVDQPAVTLTHLQQMLQVVSTGAELVATEYNNTIGVPAYFSRQYFGEFETLTGDSGAKALLEKHVDRTSIITLEANSLDIDTEQDWTNFLKTRQDTRN